MTIRVIEPQCRRCRSYNMYFDSHAGFAICPDCGWDTHRDEDYLHMMSQYRARKWQSKIIDEEVKEDDKQ